MFRMLFRTLGLRIPACVHLLRIMLNEHMILCNYLDLGFETLDSTICESKLGELTVVGDWDDCHRAAPVPPFPIRLSNFDPSGRSSQGVSLCFGGFHPKN